jgi:hypothetical protein
MFVGKTRRRQIVDVAELARAIPTGDTRSSGCAAQVPPGWASGPSPQPPCSFHTVVKKCIKEGKEGRQVE